MNWLPWRRRGTDPIRNKLDREAERDDISALDAFIASRPGVELYLEPETTATDTTVLAVASDGEWIRRRVGSPRVGHRIARRHRVPLYEAERVGYPERMRRWNRDHPERRSA